MSADSVRSTDAPVPVSPCLFVRPNNAAQLNPEGREQWLQLLKKSRLLSHNYWLVGHVVQYSAQQPMYLHWGESGQKLLVLLESCRSTRDYSTTEDGKKQLHHDDVQYCTPASFVFHNVHY
jgi:hypothetical protein